MRGRLRRDGDEDGECEAHGGPQGGHPYAPAAPAGHRDHHRDADDGGDPAQGQCHPGEHNGADPENGQHRQGERDRAQGKGGAGGAGEGAVAEGMAVVLCQVSVAGADTAMPRAAARSSVRI